MENLRQVIPRKLIVYIVVMTGLILLGTRIPVLSVIALLVGVWVVAQNDEQCSLAFLIFIMPMASIFKLSIVSPAFFTYLELLFVVMRFLRKRMRLDKLEVIILIFGIYLVVCELANGGININVTIKFIAHLYIVYAACCMNLKKHYRMHIYMYILGVIISSVIANMDPLFPIKSYVIPEGYYNNGEYIGRFTGLYKDPNYYCINVIISLSLIVLLYVRAELSLVQVFALSGPLFYFAIETVSKSAILMIIIPIMLFIIASGKRKKYGVLFSSSIAFVVLVILALENRIPALQTIMTRLLNSSTDLDSFTTHRLDLWKMYFEFFIANPLHNVFGGSVLYYTLNGAGPHNTYIDMIYQLGIVGTTFLLSILFAIFRSARKDTKRGLINYGVLFSIVIMYGMLSELQYFDPPFHLIMCYIALNIPTVYDT